MFRTDSSNSLIQNSLSVREFTHDPTIILLKHRPLLKLLTHLGRKLTRKSQQHHPRSQSIQPIYRRQKGESILGLQNRN